MKTLLLITLAITLASSLALANTGAAINKRTGNINYEQGPLSPAALVKLALKACRAEKDVAAKDCATTTDQARDYLDAACEHCAMGQSFYDEVDSNN